MQITVKVVPHSTQRYPTVGDWYFTSENKELIIIVSDMGDYRYNFLVAYHEQIEAMLCLERGIKEEDVSAFDIAFESKRQPGDLSEPGNHPEAPYFKEHQYATACEINMATMLGVDWEEYENAVNSL